MMKKNRFKIGMKIVAMSLLFLQLCSCEKYLAEKPDIKISTPDKLSDLDGMLNYYASLNERYPAAGEVLADDYFLTDVNWAASSELHRNYYIWQKYDAIGADWTVPYNNILTANVILETLEKIGFSPGEVEKARQIRGEALFLRAFNHFSLSQLFAPAYDEGTATSDLGIPIKLVTDFTKVSVRSSVKENYESILSDLKNASALLTAKTGFKYRANKASAYGLMARTYLSMREYEQAGRYADSCLQLYNMLIDYNKLVITTANPFVQFNDEVIYACRTSAPSALSQTRAKVDEGLYGSYASNDLRKTAFFKVNTDGSKAFKGNYTGLTTASVFSGLATDEMYLIRAESAARLGPEQSALADLNLLLSKRLRTGSFVPLTFSGRKEILNAVLNERRKELCFRTLRWSDLRRLNKEEAFKKTLIRKLNNQVFELKPGDNGYTLQIDRSAILLSGMPQNP